jgi:hypothetical protein
MTKWTRTRRDPGRTYLDEETLQRNRRMLARVRELVECGIEAEPEVVNAAKVANPEITEEQLKEVVMLFRELFIRDSMIDSIIKLFFGFA